MRRAARPAKRLPQKILDLSVQAAQIIVCPALNALEHGGVDAKQEGFPVRHRVPGLLMNRPGVEDRLGRLLAAQYDEQIADHSRLPFLIQMHDALV
jgi:hypothetical protein